MTEKLKIKEWGMLERVLTGNMHANSQEIEEEIKEAEREEREDNARVTT